MRELETGMAILSAFAFVVAACIGSFLNVCIYRIPQDLSVVSPASRCPSCGHGIRPYDNIPIVSWLVLRGRCRDCGSPISSLYPSIELLTGLVGWLLWRRVFADPMDFDAAHAGMFALYLVLAAALIAQAFIDLRYQIIPFELSIYLVPVFIGGWALLEHLGLEDGVGFQRSALGALFGGGAFAGMSLLWRVFLGRKPLGGGDIYLMMLIGAGLGLWPALPYVLVLASFLALAVGLSLVVIRRGFFGIRFPFGPSLGLAALTYLIHGPLGAERYFQSMAWMFGFEPP